jgi:hypothetical protein
MISDPDSGVRLHVSWNPIDFISVVNASWLYPILFRLVQAQLHISVTLTHTFSKLCVNMLKLSKRASAKVLERKYSRSLEVRVGRQITCVTPKGLYNAYTVQHRSLL